MARHVISLRCNDLYAIGVTADIGRPSGPKGSVENDPSATLPAGLRGGAAAAAFIGGAKYTQGCPTAVLGLISW